MRRQWEEDESGFHKLPPRAWPPTQPKAAERSALEQAAHAACASDQPKSSWFWTSAEKKSEGCTRAIFDLATCLTFNMLDPAAGLKHYRDLAAGGDADAIVAVAVVVLEAIGHEPDEASYAEALRLMSKAAEELEHPQALYEMGCLYYLGSDSPPIVEDPKRAFHFFERAAEHHQHTSALFMLAELLTSGLGCETDEARAIPLLHSAAMRGHRMARQYLIGYLDADTAQSAASAPPGSAAASAEAPKMSASRALAVQHTAALPSLPTSGSEHFQIFRGDTGEPVSASALLSHAASCDAVLIGECHDDPVAHSLEAYFLISLAARREATALSLEMFEADTQLVLDEYMRGAIRERDMLQDARPWANYNSDYRPLVEFARSVGLPVIAANAPRRYVGAVGRNADVLRKGDWPAHSMSWLPPLPLPQPSDGYLKHLREDKAVVRLDQVALDDEFAAANHGGPSSGGATMAGGGESGGEGAEVERRCPYIGLSGREGLLEPMLLWDAAMAHAIARSLDGDPSRLVIHMCGSFHCERNLGVAEMLQVYRPATKTCTVVIYPEEDCHTFEPSRHAGMGDYVVLTDASLSRSYDYMA